MTDDETNRRETDGGSRKLPVNRRNVLAARAVGFGVGGGLTAVATDGGQGGDSVGDHDHGGDTLGESEPVESIAAGRIDVDAVTEGDVTRVLQNGRGTNEGDPAETGQWNGYADFAEESNAIVRDTTTGDWYGAVDGEWVPAWT